MMKVLSLVNQTKDQCANLRRSANLLLHENKIAYFTRDYSYYTIDNYPPSPQQNITTISKSPSKKDCRPMYAASSETNRVSSG